MVQESAAKSRKLHYALWVIQWLLGALFIFGGGMKLVMPLEQLAGPIAVPGWFLRFIGVAELAGGLGLILPSLLRIRPGLTSLAAAGLVVIMVGATALTMASGMYGSAVIPLVVGLLLALIAYGRSRPAVIPTRGT